MFIIMPETADRGEPKPPCTTADLNLFFPEHDSQYPDMPTKRERLALNVCAMCPLAARTRCLEGSLRFRISDQNGIVGGKTAAQRKAIIRARGNAQLTAVA